MDWESIAHKAQLHRDASLAKVEPMVPEVPGPEQLPLDVTGLPAQLLNDLEITITETPCEKLLQDLGTGKLSSTVVVKAFLRRAGLAQKLANCITELLPERALQRAKDLDDYFAKHSRPVGPLHGLPISVKEHISMKGLGLNAAFVSYYDKVGNEDAHNLQILWKAGAVFYARTTEPQILMHLETSSNYFGTTVNPFNRNLSAGGSSGGEGALLGLRGSCLGIGTDIGGSVRSPAANNGVYGLRPTSYRVPCGGNFATMLSQDHIIPTTGPLSTSVEGIRIFMKTILDAKPWVSEPSLIPMPWKQTTIEPSPGKPLKIGVMWSDGVVQPHPPVTRALREVTHKLSSIPDVTVQCWSPYEHEYAWSIIASLYFADGGDEDIKAIEASGEPWRELTKHILKNEFTKKLSIAELWDWLAKRDKYRADYARHWASTGSTSQDGTEEPAGAVDAILCPVGPGVAPLHETARWWGYTAQWNLLDYPAMVFPVSKVDVVKDVKDLNYTPQNEKDKFNYELYEPEKYKGAPVSLQIVGRRYEDEKVVEIVDYITKKLGLPFTA